MGALRELIIPHRWSGLIKEHLGQVICLDSLSSRYKCMDEGGLKERRKGVWGEEGKGMRRGVCGEGEGKEKGKV